MRGLALKTLGFRHGRARPGHPRREAYRQFHSIAPSGAEKSVRIRNPSSHPSTWMPGTSPIGANLSFSAAGFSGPIRHARACPGHPRRDVESKSQNLAPTATIERVGVLKWSGHVTTWMPGTRPGMTLKASRNPLNLAPMGLVPGIHAVGRRVGFKTSTLVRSQARRRLAPALNVPAWMAGTSPAMTEPARSRIQPSLHIRVAAGPPP
jgi:hypothetical protein